ncbi:MAG: hypothetical protein EOP83_29845 [Verrucomicrobiaceae bacterium]|nr:MAG: hypothetical protein EOP83_29845 [Verrucomicrobiaceae bacterium]
MKFTSAVNPQTHPVMGDNVSSLEIVSEDGAYYLFRISAKGRLLGDTWHQSIEEAMRQATNEFSVNPGDWMQVDD